MRGAAEEEQVNLGVRVPRDLDHKRMGVVYHRRLSGVRASTAAWVAVALENRPHELTPALTRVRHTQRLYTRRTTAAKAAGWR